MYRPYITQYALRNTQPETLNPSATGDASRHPGPWDNIRRLLYLIGGTGARRMLRPYSGRCILVS